MQNASTKKLVTTVVLFAVALVVAGMTGLLLVPYREISLLWLSLGACLAGLATLVGVGFTCFRAAKEKGQGFSKQAPRDHANVDAKPATAREDAAAVKGLLSTIESLNRSIDSMTDAARKFAAARARQRAVNDAMAERDSTHGDKRPLH